MPETKCFLDQGRPCTAECAAYEKPADDKETKDKLWAPCLILINVHRVTKHLGTLVSEMGRIRNHFTDQARTHQPPPARPT